MRRFFEQNTGKLVGWAALTGAAACFFGTHGVGVVLILLTLTQIFGK